MKNRVLPIIIVITLTSCANSENIKFADTVNYSNVEISTYIPSDNIMSDTENPNGVFGSEIPNYSSDALDGTSSEIPEGQSSLSSQDSINSDEPSTSTGITTDTFTGNMTTSSETNNTVDYRIIGDVDVGGNRDITLQINHELDDSEVLALCGSVVQDMQYDNVKIHVIYDGKELKSLVGGNDGTLGFIEN